MVSSHLQINQKDNDRRSILEKSKNSHNRNNLSFDSATSLSNVSHLTVRKTRTALEMFIRRGRKQFRAKFPNKGKYSKRCRSNVSVIIVRVIFIRPFLFQCLLCNHSFQTNPNKITNCFKLILSLFTTLQTTFAQCVRLFLIFEQIVMQLHQL